MPPHRGLILLRRVTANIDLIRAARYVGIDYSGAQTPTASLKGLRVYLAEGDMPPAEIRTGRTLTILLLSPDSNFLRTGWKDIVPEANIIPLPGLPEGIQALADHLAAL